MKKVTAIAIALMMISVEAGTGKRTMVLGDSITHLGYWEYYLQLFETLRNPGSDARYYNAGYCGGSLVTGMDNLKYELDRVRPGRAFVMFGMNDVHWWEYDASPVLSQQRRAAADGLAVRYEENYAKLINEFVAAGVTDLVLLTPTPFDEYSDLHKASRRRFVNEYGLANLSKIVRQLAVTRGVEVIDLNRFMAEAYRRYPKMGLSGDHIHPSKSGHLMMAAECLRTLSKDDPVAEVTLDATGAVIRVENARVTNVVALDDRLGFDYLPRSLPFPDCPEYREVMEINPDFQRYNREVLVVVGLSDGEWELRTEGRALGTYSAERLNRGVNLAELDTPCRRVSAQAMKAMLLLHDFDVPRRNRVCARIKYKSFGIPLNDTNALKTKIDEYLAGLKSRNAPEYDKEKATAEDVLEAAGRDAEINKEEEKLYSELAAIRPVCCRIELKMHKR